MADAEDVKEDVLTRLAGQSRFTKDDCMLCVSWVYGQLIKGVAGQEAFENSTDTVSVEKVLKALRTESDKAITTCERLLSPREEPVVVQEPSSLRYRLEFTHDCSAWGCLNPRCDLCEKNPRRMCSIPFEKKYFKGDPVKAKCGAAIALELINVATADLADSADGLLEMFIVDGNKFDQTFPDGIQRCDDDGLEACALLTGNENRQLLVSTDKSANHPDGKIVLALQGGRAVLPEIIVTQSSEALLSGRRPPFRLAAKVANGQDSISSKQVAPAISPGFVVASGRSRLAQKKCIPSMDDPLSKLEHMGKERVRKLKELRMGTAQLHLTLPPSLPDEITKVGHFKTLVLQADKDGHLKQRLLHMLKMSDKAWDEAREHALAAVANDTRMRAWYKDDNMGLLFVCHLGETDMERPVALIRNNDVINKDRQGPRDRELVGQLQNEALKAWRKGNHPGWTFYPFDSEVYAQDPNSLPPPDEAQRSSFRSHGHRQMPGLGAYPRELWTHTTEGVNIIPQGWFSYANTDINSSVRSSADPWELKGNAKRRRLQDAPEARLPTMPPPTGFGPENVHKPANVEREFDRLRAALPKRSLAAMPRARDSTSLPIQGMAGLSEWDGHTSPQAQIRTHASATPWVGAEGSVNHGSGTQDQSSVNAARLGLPDAEFRGFGPQGQLWSQLQPLLTAASQPFPPHEYPSSASTGRHISVQSSIHNSVQSSVQPQSGSSTTPTAGVEHSKEERISAKYEPMLVDQRPVAESGSMDCERREGTPAATSVPLIALADGSQGLTATERGTMLAGVDLGGAAGIGAATQQQVLLLQGNNWEQGGSMSPYNVVLVVPTGQGGTADQEEPAAQRPLPAQTEAKED
eukprot:evm.model.scf_131.5 EVM.evm.TU.scf_131.5   scf_131:33256-39556(-)